MSVGVKIIIFFCMITHYVKPFSDTHRWIRYTPSSIYPHKGVKAAVICLVSWMLWFYIMCILVSHLSLQNLPQFIAFCSLILHCHNLQNTMHLYSFVCFTLILICFSFFLFIWRMSNLGSIMTVITFWLTGNHLRWDHGHRHSVSVLFVIFMFSNIELRWVHHYPYMYLNCFDYVWHFHTNILGVNPVTTGLPQLWGYHHHSKPCLWCSKFPGSGNCRCIS